MTEPDSTRPLDVAEYRKHLAPLLGPAAEDANDSAPIATIIDWIFRLALARKAEEIVFTVRPDDALEIRLRRGTTGTALPPLAPRGSAVSRLFVLGGLEKGEAERLRPQESQTMIHGTRMAFETRPLGRWKEDVRVRIVGESFVCSDCLSEHPSRAIHVIPWWNDHVRDFVTTFRCDRCWPGALAETRLRTAAPNDEVLGIFCGFLDRHGLSEEAGSILRSSPQESARRIGILLGELESGHLILSPV